jgi:hypothetical protein
MHMLCVEAHSCFMCWFAGIPDTPAFDLEEAGDWTISYRLSWSTLSYSPVLKYRLQYRKHQVGLLFSYSRTGDARIHCYFPAPIQEQIQ